MNLTIVAWSSSINYRLNVISLTIIESASIRWMLIVFKSLLQELHKTGEEFSSMLKKHLPSIPKDVATTVIQCFIILCKVLKSAHA